MNLVSQIVGQVDVAVTSTAAQYFQTTASSVLSLYLALLGLLFAFIGMMVALNVYALSMRDAFQIGARIVLIFAFGLSWPNFSLLYDALTNASQNLAMSYFAIGGSGLAAQPDVAMDAFATNMADIVDTVTQAMGSITRGLVGALLYGILALLMAAYVLIVAFSKIMIAFLLGFAPIAMIFTIFEKTKSLFEAWLASLIGYLMYPVAAAGIIGSVINVSNQYTLQATGGSTGTTNLGSILGFLVIILVGIFALKSIPTAVSNITGHFSLANVAPQALKISALPGTMLTSSSRARNFWSGVRHGTTEKIAQHNISRTWADAGKSARSMPGNVTRRLNNYFARKST